MPGQPFIFSPGSLRTTVPRLSRHLAQGTVTTVTSTRTFLQYFPQPAGDENFCGTPMKTLSHGHYENPVYETVGDRKICGTPMKTVPHHPYDKPMESSLQEKTIVQYRHQPLGAKKNSGTPLKTGPRGRYDNSVYESVGDNKNWWYTYEDILTWTLRQSSV